MTAIHDERISHKRKLVSSMVSNDALRAFAIREKICMETFCRSMGGETDANRWSSPKNMTVECQKLSLPSNDS